MSTAIKGGYEVGQRLWWGLDECVILKVGRKWLTVQNRERRRRPYQVDIRTLRVNSEFGGQLHEDHELWLQAQAANAAWAKLRAAILRRGRLETVTAGSIHHAAVILGIPLDEEPA